MQENYCSGHLKFARYGLKLGRICYLCEDNIGNSITMFRYMTIAAIAAFALDQLSKLGILWGMGLMDVLFIEVIPGYLHFIMVWNHGINFGWFSSNYPAMRWILVGLSIVACIAVALWMRRESNRFALLSAGVLIGGALGNALDRLIYGAVADFLNVTCCGIVNPFAFNVADIAIFIGAIGLILYAGNNKSA